MGKISGNLRLSNFFTSEAKFEQHLASVLSVQGKPFKKRAKKLSKNISKKKLGYKGSYKTLGEAQKGLAQFCEKEMWG